jgi:plasmid stabilization system protein ParE
VPRQRYVLTARAASDLREAQIWSRARWGRQLTRRYFEDLHRGALFIAENHLSLARRHGLAGGTTLSLYPLREHYIVYEPLDDACIAIVAVIRQGRDVPAILRRWAAPIRAELVDIRKRIARGQLSAPSRQVHATRRRSSSRRRSARPTGR